MLIVATRVRYEFCYSQQSRSPISMLSTRVTDYVQLDNFSSVVLYDNLVPRKEKRKDLLSGKNYYQKEDKSRKYY